MKKLLQKCRIFLLALILVCPLDLVAQTTTTGDGTKLGGFMVYARDGWSTSMRGFYSLVADEDPEITAMKLEPYKDIIGGILKDGAYYGISREYNYQTGQFRYYYYVFNSTTWEMTDYSLIDDANSSLALTYDPVTDQVFALSMGTTGGTNYTNLSTYDLETATATNIGEITGEGVPVLGFATLSVDVNGDMYGIAYNGNFYKIDKTTADAALVGHLGVTPNGVSSMVFDHRTNKLYWSSCLMDFYANLYEIDINTGLAHEITKFPRNEAFAGLYVIGPAAEDDAPAKPLNLRISAVEEGSMHYYITYDVPETTYGGSPLGGNVNAEIWVDGILIYTQMGLSAGDGAEYLHTFDNPAEYTIEVYLVNDAGKGPKAKKVAWIGPDTPAAISELQAERTEESYVTLTWEAPQGGMHGGYLDVSTLTYQIVRNEDNVTVATGLDETTFTDENAPEPMYYTYTVTPSSSGGAGEATTTGKVFAGSAFGFPYQENFDERAAFNNYWSIFDLNGGDKWEWNSTMKDVRYSNTKDATAEDWVISSPFYMSSGRIYKIGYKLTSQSPSYPENCNVTLGTGSDPASQTITIAEYPGLQTNFNDAVPYINFIAVPESNEYYMGFYSYSDENGWNLIFDDVTIDEIEVPVISDLDGEVQDADVSLTWSIPDEIEGVTLLGYNVYRDGVLITEDPIAGNSFTDTNLEEGTYEYEVTAVYEMIESAVSNIYTASVGGMSNIRDNSHSGYLVYAQGGEIIIEGAADKLIMLFTPDGKQVLNVNNNNDVYRIPAEKGIYLVKIENEVTKVIVR